MTIMLQKQSFAGNCSETSEISRENFYDVVILEDF